MPGVCVKSLAQRENTQLGRERFGSAEVAHLTGIESRGGSVRADIVAM